MEQPDFSLAGQVALVTGASRGIGHDLVLALARAGAVVGAAARSPDHVADLLDEVAAAGGRAFAVPLDVTDLPSVEPAVQQVVREHGRLDVLVNNAGLGENHDALDVTEADWDALMDVNLKGLFFVTQAVARVMVPRGYGRVVNLGSQAGLVGIRRHAVYSASKAERLDDPAFAADVLARIPVGRFGTTTDVAGAVLYLASPAAGLVTGTTLVVDGGWTAQ